MTDQPLTVRDLIRALSKLPPGMEIWHQNVDDFSPIVGAFPMDETAGLGVKNGKLVLTYDWTLSDGDPLDFTAPVSVYDMTDEELTTYVGSPDFLKASLEKSVAGLKALFEAEVQALADHREVEAGLARVELERTREQLIAFLLNFHDKITFTDGVHAR